MAAIIVVVVVSFIMKMTSYHFEVNIMSARNSSVEQPVSMKVLAVALSFTRHR